MNKTTEALKYDILVLKIAARFLHKAVSAKERCDYWIVKELIAKKEMQLAEPVKQDPVCNALTDSEREKYEEKIKVLGNAITRQFYAAEELASRVMELEEYMERSQWLL